MSGGERVGQREIRDAVSRGARPTVVDRIINYVDPVRGLVRMRSRMTQALVGGYTGGSRSRRSLESWKVTSGSADADLLTDLSVLRDRSRDLVRNAPIAGGAVNTIATNVVGTGLAMQSRIRADVLGMSEEAQAAWQRNAELEFSVWAQSPDCDITRTQNFYELQNLVCRAALESGDVLTLLPSLRRQGDLYGLKLQIIEADRLSNPGAAIDAPALAGGVQMDEYGAPVGYHIMRQHPGDLRLTAREWDLYPAFGQKTGRRNVLHHFVRLRPGQTRGEPLLAPVIDSLKQLDRYTEAEIMAAVVSGMFTVFVHSDGPGLDLANSQSMGYETGATSSDKDAKMGYGAMVDLRPNEKVEFADPGRPNAAYDPFVMSILKQIGMRLGMPFEVLMLSFTASYSASRAALLQAWKFFGVRRAWLAASFCQPVYETFLAEAVAKGRIAAPGFFADPVVRAAFCGAEWQGDGPGSIDPLKEALAIEKRLDIGITNLQKETSAYDGSDWETNHAQQAKERRMRERDGLLADKITGEPLKDPANPAGDPAQSADLPEQT